MLALQQLQGTWPVSGWIFHLFKKIVRRIQNQNEFLPNEPVNGSPLQTKSPFPHGQSPSVPGVKPEQHIPTNDPTQYQDPNLSHLYAMPGHPANRFLFQAVPGIAVPIAYNNPVDWQNIYDDGAWGDFEYEF